MNFAVPGKTVGMVGKTIPSWECANLGQKIMASFILEKISKLIQSIEIHQGGGGIGLHLLFLVTLQIEKEGKKRL